MQMRFQVNQRQKVAFPYSFAFLHHFLLLMHGDAVKIVKTTQSQEVQFPSRAHTVASL